MTDRTVVGFPPSPGSDRRELAAVRDAVGSRLGVVSVLLVVAGLAWWSTAARMSGMDAGPGTGLGTLGWFTGVWVVMMAAMMLPSLAPTAAVYANLARRHEPSRSLLFVGGYLLLWSAAGVVAYGLFELGRSLFAGDLAWSSNGRWLAGGVLALAALYQLTPLKGACLAKCRSPMRVLGERWREGRLGALAMGVRSGGWCIGCSWALMAALFAVGVMSLTWMALVAALVALEKIGPSPRLARVATATVLAALAVGIFAAPHQVPGLVVPGSPAAMHAMKAMPGATHGMKAMPGATHGMKAMPGARTG
jgi:predicted metal-binding membrane protein